MHICLRGGEVSAIKIFKIWYGPVILWMRAPDGLNDGGLSHFEKPQASNNHLIVSAND